MSDLHLEVFGDGEPAVFVHGSFGWGLDTFPHQRALADRYRVILVDRRGFGDSPPAEDVGWPTDMHDIARLLSEVGGAHLVGQSYGAVVSLLAAGLRPDAVRSLVAIEPPAFEIAKGHEADTIIGAQKPVFERAGAMTARDINDRMAAFTLKDWAAIESTRRERWPGDAPIPLDVLAAAPFPKVLARGAWRPDLFPGRETTAQAHRIVCEIMAEAINASVVVFNDSAHNPQMEEAERFNALLQQVWQSAHPS
ncbi:MAG: alpha/beta hydrolase [Armatimonadetes bacterium]|nr:alpha/beta hydrolase [Armatimonadota bacterium]